MRRNNIIFILLFHFIFLNCEAQLKEIYYPGYVIEQGMDTFFTKIEFGPTKFVENSNLFNKVSYINNSGDFYTSYPGRNIWGFGFSIDSIHYDFSQIKVEPEISKNEKVFALRLIDGQVKLYFYAYDGNDAKMSFQQGNLAITSFEQQYFIHFIQKGDEKIIRTKSKFGLRVDKTIYNNKKWLKNYFKDYKELTKRIGKEIKTFDIETIIKEYNVWFDKQRTVER